MPEATEVQKATIGDAFSGMLNAFIDPAATAKQAVKKGFWIWPILILCLAVAAYSLLTAPLSLQVMQQHPPNNMTPEQMEKAMPMIKGFTYAGALIGPIIIVLVTLLGAWLVSLACSVLGIVTKFRDVFSLISAFSLITVVQLIASYVVVTMKGEDLQSTQDLRPPFGLDIFFSGLKGPLWAILNFFSIFEVWFLVVFGLGLAYMTRTTKGKAFLAITPAWLIPLIFAIIGSLFQK